MARRPLRRWTDEEILELQRLHALGWTMQAMADALDRQRVVVGRQLHKLGLKPNLPYKRAPKPAASATLRPTAREYADRLEELAQGAALSDKVALLCGAAALRHA